MLAGEVWWSVHCSSWSLWQLLAHIPGYQEAETDWQPHLQESLNPGNSRGELLSGCSSIPLG